jgi:putative ABC transport system permease protein
VRQLDRKLLRDLRKLAPQLAAAALLLTAGLSMLVMATGLIRALETARDRYYTAYRMADLAVAAVRAPERLATRLREAPGVTALETRVTGLAALTLEGVTTTLSARLVSLPPNRAAHVNAVYLREGRLPLTTQPEEILINSAFAEARALRPGARLTALIRGRQEQLDIVGIADSPEFVFISPPGELLPQADTFAIVWMGREGLARALDMDGAFNEAVFRLGSEANAARAMTAIDAALAPFGGQGAIGRDRILSAQFVNDEIAQLRTMSTVLPFAFLLVAAFLVNVTLSRLVATERSNIGLLKSFGYSAREIATHYGKFALIVAIFGVLGAIALGSAIGELLATVYREVYRFPSMVFVLEPAGVAWACLIGLGACLVGAANAVVSAARLAPAVALAPPTPVAYANSHGIDAALGGFDTASRIVARRILRFPRRSGATVLGIAMACGLLVMAGTFPASTSEILRVNFDLISRQSATLTFAEPQGPAVMHEAAHLPGVRAVEPMRVHEAMFTSDHASVREGLFGLPANPRLNRVLGADLHPIAVRQDGLTLSRRLSDLLKVDIGDHVRVQLLDGARPVSVLQVRAIADTFLGGAAYIQWEAISAVFGEPPRISSLHLLMDPTRSERLAAQMRETPAVISTVFLKETRRSQEELFARGAGFMASLFIAFAGLMAAGIAFSTARITLAEQQRDLATLRVLGFSPNECSGLLLGEIAVLTILAIPLGLLIGYWSAAALMNAFQTDLFRLPMVVDIARYAFSVVVVLVCVAFATLYVRRDIDTLSLTKTLKARS